MRAEPPYLYLNSTGDGVTVTKDVQELAYTYCHRGSRSSSTSTMGLTTPRPARRSLSRLRPSWPSGSRIGPSRTAALTSARVIPSPPYRYRRRDGRAEVPAAMISPRVELRALDDDEPPEYLRTGRASHLKTHRVGRYTRRGSRHCQSLVLMDRSGPPGRCRPRRHHGHHRGPGRPPRRGADRHRRRRGFQAVTAQLYYRLARRRRAAQSGDRRPRLGHRRRRRRDTPRPPTIPVRTCPRANCLEAAEHHVRRGRRPR
jgi:hypothetical protein